MGDVNGKDYKKIFGVIVIAMAIAVPPVDTVRRTDGGLR